jgi:hypothetical protein
MIRRSPANSIIVHSKDISNNTVTTIPGAFSEVKFDSHDADFLMLYLACENPDCPCVDVLVNFAEQGVPRLRHKRMEFGVQFNVNTWQVMKINGESPITRPLIDEFVSGLNDEHKDHILAKYRGFRRAVKNAARFTMPANKIQNGEMVSASKVFGVSEQANSCGLTRPLLEEHQGNVYRLMDFYCMNPSCKCGDTSLNVFRADKEVPVSKEPWITMHLHFEGKRGVSGVKGDLTSQQAAALAAEWIRKDPALLGDIEERYRRIKDIGRRILGRKKQK